jgi:DNA repair photolyase
MRPIYKPSGRAREYCELAANIYTGCTHGCIYCYAPTVLRKTQKVFATNVQPRPGIVEAVRKQLERDGIKGKTIMLCFTCDPYPAGVDTAATREVIKVIKESGNNVQILTKGGEIARRDFDLLGEGDSFGVTITGDATAQITTEPRAADNLERLENLKRAYRFGIKTWISIEPVFVVGVAYYLIEIPIFIDLYRIGKLNYMPSDIDWGEFGRKCERLCQKYGRNYYIKDDLRREMGR